MFKVKLHAEMRYVELKKGAKLKQEHSQPEL